MKVKFVPQNVEFEIKPGQSVLHVAQDNQIFIKSVCRGVPSCAECRVKLVQGEHVVIQPAGPELALIGSAHFVDGRRLSCQLKCFGDITVDMTEQIEKQAEIASGKPRNKRNNKEESVSSHAVMGNLMKRNESPLGPPQGTGRSGDGPDAAREARNDGRIENRLDTRVESRTDSRNDKRPENRADVREPGEGSRNQNRNQDRNRNRNQDQNRNRNQGQAQGQARGAHRNDDSSQRAGASTDRTNSRTNSQNPSEGRPSGQGGNKNSNQSRGTRSDNKG